MLHAGDEVMEAKESPTKVAWAKTTFVVLFTMNLLDYLDRSVLTSMQPQIRDEFHINNTQWGLLTTVFLISYSVVSPIMGWLGDRYRRNRLLGIGVGVWSLATLGSGLATDYGHLVWARSFLGIGEATYGVIAPTILLDLFSKNSRSRLMSTFYLAMPIGTAMGMKVGAYMATTHHWHQAFYVVGLPSLFAAIFAFFLPEPVRGASEGIAEDRLKAHEKAGATKEDYIDLMVNSSYTYSVFGMAMYTFAIGGLLVWVPIYLFNTRQIEQNRAMTILGLVTLAASVIGMSAGGWLSDKMAKTKPQALFLVPGIAMFLSIPFVLIALFSTSERVIFGAILAAETLMFINTGPCNAIIANVVQPNLRAAAYAISVFAIHFLGDIWSPALIGRAADWLGDPLTMASSYGKILKSIGAVPTQVSGHPPENIVAALLIVVPALLLSAIVLIAGARHLPREMALMHAKLRAAPKTSKPDPGLPSEL
ncbi:spinster family MFS transporter [Singulisphaera sp. PoT]|uniref:spinster family MFS transporter n=1 Tax=Singulisphaera sp. PoT TaxID=3411797 RepID=UPI003BF4A986